jgi:U4/U6 small nuclear ribonucleoprotein PRP3
LTREKKNKRNFLIFFLFSKMPPKVDVSKLMAELAEKKAKLLQQKQQQQEQATSATESNVASTTSSSSNTNNNLTPQQAAAIAAARAAAAAMNVQQQLASSSMTLPANVTARPIALRLDDKGREIDATGQLVKTERHASSLANQAILNSQSESARRDANDARARAFLRQAVPLDDSADKSRARRATRGLAFVEPGSLVERAEKARDELVLCELKRQENATRWATRATLVDPLVDHAALVSEQSVHRVPLGRAAVAAAAAAEATGGVPLVEWWDAPLLADETSYDANFVAADDSFTFNDSRISLFVEHPVPVNPLVVFKPPPPTKVILTQKERKRIRKQNRAEAEAARRERVLLGLEEEKKPKATLANMMRVHGTSAVLDPTAIEAMVSREVAERKRVHDDDNLRRQLTPAQRREKRRRKLVDDTAAGTHVAVFRVRDLTHPQRRFKVNATARDCLMTGCAVVQPGFAIVIVEGGAKAVNQFKKLMLRRIDWTSNTPITSEIFKSQITAQLTGADPDAAIQAAKDRNKYNNGGGGGDDDNDNGVDEDEGPELDAETREKLDAALQPDSSNNECRLVWEGMVAARAFRTWSIETAATERAARFFLRQHNVEHFYNIAADANESFGVTKLE